MTKVYYTIAQSGLDDIIEVFKKYIENKDDSVVLIDASDKKCYMYDTNNNILLWTDIDITYKEHNTENDQQQESNDDSAGDDLLGDLLDDTMTSDRITNEKFKNKKFIISKMFDTFAEIVKSLKPTSDILVIEDSKSYKYSYQYNNYLINYDEIKIMHINEYLNLISDFLDKINSENSEVLDEKTIEDYQNIRKALNKSEVISLNIKNDKIHSITGIVTIYLDEDNTTSTDVDSIIEINPPKNGKSLKLKLIRVKDIYIVEYVTDDNLTIYEIPRITTSDDII